MKKKYAISRKKRLCRLEEDPLYRAKPLTSSAGSLTNEEIDTLIYDLPKKWHSERSEESPSSGLKRWVSSPQSSLPGAPAVQGVMLSPNEDVQWSWTHTTNGSYVSGYTIVPRVTPRAVILSKAKNLSRTGRATSRRRTRGANR